ncbi:MAG: CapA family protein [Rhodospirillaceae bacterium]|jgi:poly-gamma-glutamate capsule biosynthesis protein CapA/YwtB (metallophosphatase superfamily)
MADNSVVLYGVGDVGPIHEPIGKYAKLAAPVLSEADIRFGQCERTYSTRGALQVHSGGEHSRCEPGLAQVFEDCGFDIVSVASNHAMDWGADALLDTIELFEGKGIATVGAGKNLEEARKPAIIERNGVKVAFLAYCTILREGYAAGADQAGIAPLRAHTYYEPFDYQAGVPPQVVTVPYEDDLNNMLSDIAAAKKKADNVVVSIHWGIHFIPKMLADYQTIAAKAAFGAGADLILGHHAHAPKAIGVFDGKTCFYSLSNFIMSSTAKSPEKAAAFEKKYSVTLDPDYPHLSYGSDAKRSLVAKAVMTAKGVQQTSFLPALINPDLQPEVLKNGDPRFDESVKFMEWVSEDVPHRFNVSGNEVLIQG